MNNLLSRAEDWAEEAGIAFNPQKTELMLVSRKRNDSFPPLILAGKVLEMGGKINYLGVQIDRQLSFKEHIREKAKKAASLLYHCNQMVGTGWGLSPERVWWVYQAIVRPTISHGAIAWAHKLDKQSMKDICTKLQRKCLIAMTGAMRGTPTAGLEAALGIVPLHIWLQGAALKQAALNRQEEAVHEGHRGWTDACLTQIVPRDLPIDKITKTAAPGRTTRQSTGRIFEVFTDGSRMKGKTGAGWSVTRGLQSTAEGRVHLGCHATVFQAETVAIHDFLSWLNNDTVKYKRGDRFRIWSDSQSAIQAIKARKTKSAVVGDCQEQLRKARTNYHIELGWIKGHADIPGNEWADALAKEASELRPNICEPAVPLPTGEIKRRIDGWMREKWLSEWANRKDCRQTKAMLGKPKEYNLIKVEAADRRGLRKWASFTTGHCKLRRHLAIIQEDDINTRTCRLCGDEEEEETPLHMLNCPAMEYETRVMEAFLQITDFSLKAFLLYIDAIERKIHVHDPLPVF
jgi:ribonuclease HI